MILICVMACARTIQYHMSLYSRWSTKYHRSRLCTNRCYGETCSIDILMCKTHLFKCTLLLISIRVTTCACTINITRYCTVNGVPENSIQNDAQPVAIVTKHPKL